MEKSTHRTAAYYDSDFIGRLYGMEGAGIVGLMTGDQLHPPMVHDKSLWEDGTRWKEAAEQHCRQLADLIPIQSSHFVLDVGCGIGGPARLLGKEYGCRITGINISRLQIETAAKLTDKELKDQVSFEPGDAERIPFENDTFDVVWTLNMFYHVQHKKEAIAEFARVAKPGGHLLFDDWFITDQATDVEIDTLKKSWQNPSFLTSDQLKSLLHHNNFQVEKEQDLTSVGRELMPRYFESQFREHFAPKIITMLPDYGEEIVETLLKDINFTIQLYQQGKFEYHQLWARLSD